MKGKGAGEGAGAGKGVAILALALALALAPPLASAASADVRLVEAGGGAWNGVSAAQLAPDESSALVWVPAGARIQSVEGGAWQAAGPDALRIEAAPGATGVHVRFDYAPSPHLLARIVAPQDYERLDVRVRALDKAVVSPDAALFDVVESGEGGAWRMAQLAPALAGDLVTLRVVPHDRIGELPVLLVVLALALVTLVGGVLWHVARPPLEGRTPERFLDHLTELQARLLPPAVAFLTLNILYFAVGLRAAQWRGVPLVLPVLGIESSLSARAFAALAERLVPAGVDLVALRPVESVLAQVQATLFLAFATTLPLILFEVGAFLAPALLPRERRIARATLPTVGALLLAGALFGYLLMAPFMMRTLYGYAPGLGARPLLSVADLVSFALLLVLAFAIAFQLPVAMYALSRLGIVRAATFRKYARHAVVAIALAAGILTPDPSVVSQLLVALPVTGLYLLGIAAAMWGERTRARSVAPGAAAG